MKTMSEDLMTAMEYKTVDVINKLIEKTLNDNDFNNRHGSFL